MPIGMIDMTTVVVCRHPDGQNANNVLHWTVTGDTTLGSPTLDAVADSVAARLQGDYTTWLNAHCTFQGVYVNRITVPVPLSGKSSNPPAAGTVVGDPLPSQVSAVVSLSISDPAFKRKGRIFLGFGAEGNNTIDGLVDATYAAGIHTIVATWIAGITCTLSGGVFILHLQVKKAAGIAYTPVTGARVRQQWGTQRRRSGLNRGDTPF